MKDVGHRDRAITIIVLALVVISHLLAAGTALGMATGANTGIRYMRASSDTIPTGDAQPCPGTPTVTDIDGNVYNTVKIGEQCWMKENLRVTRYADGTYLATGSTSSTEAMYYTTPGDASVYGLLYNLRAATRGWQYNANPSIIQGICPTGWHVPSYNEVLQLKNYVINVGNYGCNGNSSYIAKALASTLGWPNTDTLSVCAVANNPAANNLSGFSFVPHGYFFNGSSGGFGSTGYSWTTTAGSNTFSGLYYDLSIGSEDFIPAATWANGYGGLAVRCAKGNTVATVTTNQVSNVATTTATCGGNVLLDGGETVTARGICWSTSQTPTVSDSHTTVGSGTGMFTSNLTGLDPDVTYYVRAYAVNSLGTAYGEVMSFTTLVACPPPENITADAISSTSAHLAWTSDADSYTLRYRTAADSVIYFFDDFENGISDWTVVRNGEGNVNTDWQQFNPNNWTSGGYEAYSGTYVVVGRSWSSQGYNVDNWLITPAVTLDGTLSFWVRDDGSYHEHYDVYVSTGSNAISDFSLLYSPGDASSSWTEISVDLSGFQGVTGYLAIRLVDYDQDYLLIDNFGIFGSITAAGEWQPSITTASNSANITGLTPETKYEVQVQADCGDDGESVWSALANFTTDSCSGVEVTISGNTTICRGNSTMLTAVGGNSYLWSTGETSASITVSPNTTTIYSVTSTDSYGCSATAITAVVVGTPISSVVISGNHDVCYLGPENYNVTLTAWVNGIFLLDATYTWYENGQYRPNPAGFDNNYRGTNIPSYGNPYVYVVEVTTAEGCSLTSAPFEVNVWEMPTVNITGNANSICAGEDITLNANVSNYSNNSMLTYKWYVNEVNNNHLIDGATHDVEVFEPTSGTTNYIVEVARPTNYYFETCVKYDTFTVEVFSVPSVTINSNTPLNINYGSIVKITANGAVSYVWSTGATSATITDTPTASTTYTVTGTNEYGCSNTASITIVVQYVTPTISTTAVSNIITTSATCGGNVTFDGGETVTARGICWSTSPSPTTDDSHTSDGMGTGTFTSALTGLTPGTTYYVRAYATNSVGTAYGNEVTFTTLAIPAGDALPCPGHETVTDYDGNIYNTVKIGEQCWMKENLRVTHYADGVEIPMGTTTSNGIAYRYYPNNNENNVATYGYLYNWTAAMHGANSSTSNPSGVQGICPTGWHVPSDAEWTQLTDYVSNIPAYWCGGNTSYIGKALASNTGWNYDNGSCTVGNDQNTNNLTGFSGMPAGYFGASYYGGFGNDASMYSATLNSNNTYAYGRYLYPNRVDMGQFNHSKNFGRTVRCVLGDGANLPAVGIYGDTVETNLIYVVSNVTYDGNAEVTARGVCWNTTGAPTLADAHTSDGSGTGVFTSSITGLEPNTTYYVRAYATNSMGTAYSSEESFTTPEYCQLTFEMHDGFGDGWNGNKIRVHNHDTVQEVTLEDGNYGVVSVPVYNGALELEWVDGSWKYECSVTITGPCIDYSTTSAPSGYFLNGNFDCQGGTPAVPSFSYSMDNTCNSVVVLFENTSINAETCFWDIAGFATDDWNPGFEFTESGAYTVALLASNSSCELYWEQTQDITVTVPDPIITSFDTVVCSVDLPITWKGHTFIGAETYTTTLQAANGCDSTVTLTLNSTDLPTISHTPDTLVNADTPITLWASGANSLIWTNADGDTLGIGGTLTVTPTETTTYYVTGSTASNNLVVNGDFEQGNTGFTSAYSYVNDGSHGHYYVAHENHEMWSWDNSDTIFDHTTGNGQWMMVDAYNGRNVWTQTVEVSPNTNYEFSAWFVTDNIANVRFEINSLQGEVFTTPKQRGVWEKRRIWWNSGSATTATLKITSGYAISSGNDFGIDDIAFTPFVCETTESITVNTIPAGDALPCPGHETVTDYDDNTYNTVKIGEQCWMKENLRVTHYADGVEIPMGTSASIGIAYRYCPNNNDNNVATYGYLYNWTAAMHGANSSTSNPSGVQGVCPNGWHLPSDAEWTQLTDYVTSVPTFLCNGSFIAKALASQSGWGSGGGSCTVGNNLNENNITGFNAMPAGRWSSSYNSFGTYSDMWSSTLGGESSAWSRNLNRWNNWVAIDNQPVTHGFSIRCLLGDGANLPAVGIYGDTVETNLIYVVSNVTYDGNADVTARGVCWNTTGAPTLADAHTSDGSGTGEFTSSITGLEPNTTYYVRAYATNSVGTAYSSEVIFTTTDPACQITFEMHDSWGDGWNGNKILVHNHNTVQEVTLEDGNYGVVSVPVYNGALELEWVNGSYTGECSVTITGPCLHYASPQGGAPSDTFLSSNIDCAGGAPAIPSFTYWTENTCNSVIVHFENTSTDADFASWYISDYVTDDWNPTYEFTSSGSLPVTLSVSNSSCFEGCSLTQSLSVTIPVPITTFYDTVVCSEDLPITWKGHTFTGAGIHTDTLMTANGCDSTVTLTLSVNPQPNVKIVNTLDFAEPYCPNYGILTIVAVDAETETKIPNLTYQWSGESVMPWNTEDTSLIVIIPEFCEHTYTASVHVIDTIYGCTGDASLSVWVADTVSPVYIGDVINETVEYQDQCKMYVPDFIHYLLDNASIVHNCYYFSELSQSLRQEPVEGTEITEDTPVTVYVTTPCNETEHAITGKFFARVPATPCAPSCDAFAVRILGDTTGCATDSVTLYAMVPGATPPVAVGDILCTDNSIVKPGDWPVAGKTALGVVFHVDGSGLHGWAVHLNDQSTSISWGGFDTDIPDLPNLESRREALADTNGYANTQAIRAYGDVSTYPAAWAVDLENGWYLPAAGQLRALYGEMPTINASLQIVGGTQFLMSGYWDYWSSTESTSSYAWIVYSSGYVSNYNKLYSLMVRSVRAF